jgi:drug/metabolite transporter (DMT)-like permease
MVFKKISGYLSAGILMCAGGAVLFSTKAIFVKLSYLVFPVDPIALLALRMLFSLPFFLVSAAFTSQQKGNTKFTGRQWIYIAAAGLLGYYVSSYLDFVGLQYVSAGIERLILFTYPVFVLIISAIFLKKPATRSQWVAVAFTYAGLLFAFGAEAQLQPTRDFYTGSLLILTCAVTYAAYVAVSGVVIPVVGAVKFNSYSMLIAGAAVLIHFAIASDQSLLGLPATVYWYSVCMAIIGTVLPSYLVSLGIKRLGSNTASIIATVGPVSTIVQAYYFLGEPFSALQGLGTALILGGILLISWKQSQKVDVVDSPSAT